MRVHLVGLHSATKRLADGSRRTYYYAWRGGPALKGEPGTPEFMASYNAAIAVRSKPADGVLMSIVAGYKASPDFLDLGARTRADYLKHLKAIEIKYGTFPLSGLADRRSRAEFLAWRDQLAAASRRQADYAYTVLARVLSWARGRGLIDANPCEKAGRLYNADRAEKVWSDEQEAAFMASAPARLGLALQLALWTGQRQGDLLRLPWSAYDGKRIRLRQGKTGVRVVIPVGAPLKALLDATPRRSPIILTTEDGQPWTPDGFRSSWRKACDKAEIVGVTFHDTRGSAVTRLALAGCTEPEIATLTGHSTGDVRSILDRHYLGRDDRLAEAAISKLEAHRAGTGLTNRVTNRPTGSDDGGPKNADK